MEQTLIPEPLDTAFFKRETCTVARELLGKTLVRIHPQTQKAACFKIVETEAYTEDDPACHAYQRTTGRAATLYKAPGLAYVYFIYGMYFCLNVVTEEEGRAGAVLFRALEPWPEEEQEQYQTNGPGRLCKALDITKSDFNEKPLTDPTQSLYLARGENISPQQIIATTRIGIRLGTERPWRFYLDQNPWVSVRPKKRVNP
jgi:DNA-3-methyladenine glycosylase